jgi:anti-sigma regulatory factor (Ser/Thr protein kinase)
VSARLTLPADAASVRAARRFVRESLADIGAGAASEEAETVVSELATNAVLHARTPFTIEVSRDSDTVRVSVLDLSPAMPRTRDYGNDATTGRGMRLVAAISADWGVQTQDVGKAVWFDLAADGTSAVDLAHDDGVDVNADALLAKFSDDDSTGVPPVLEMAA